MSQIKSSCFLDKSVPAKTNGVVDDEDVLTLPRTICRYIFNSIISRLIGWMRLSAENPHVIHPFRNAEAACESGRRFFPVSNVDGE